MASFLSFRSFPSLLSLWFLYPNNVVVTYESITTSSFGPFGEPCEILQGERGTLVMSAWGKHVGLFFLEPGVTEETWMSVAHKADFEWPNIAGKEMKKAIILNGTPSPRTKIERVGNVLDIVDVVGQDTGTVQLSSYTIELYGFKKSVLDNQNPIAMAGLE